MNQNNGFNQNFNPNNLPNQNLNPGPNPNNFGPNNNYNQFDNTNYDPNANYQNQNQNQGQFSGNNSGPGQPYPNLNNNNGQFNNNNFNNNNTHFDPYQNANKDFPEVDPEYYGDDKEENGGFQPFDLKGWFCIDWNMIGEIMGLWWVRMAKVLFV